MSDGWDSEGYNTSKKQKKENIVPVAMRVFLVRVACSPMVTLGGQRRVLVTWSRPRSSLCRRIRSLLLVFASQVRIAAFLRMASHALASFAILSFTPKPLLSCAPLPSDFSFSFPCFPVTTPLSTTSNSLYRNGLIRNRLTPLACASC